MSYYDDASLVVIPSGYKTSKVYAEKPTDGSGDLAFTRTGDTATRVNSAGLIEKVRTNLYPRGSALLSTGWTSVGATLTAGQTDPNSGTTALRVQLASGGSPYSYIYQIFSGSAAIYTRSVFIKGATAQTIRIIDPFTGVGSTINLTTSYQRFTAVGAGSGGNFGIQFDNNTDNGARDFTIAFVQIEEGDVATDYIPTTTAAVSVGPVANVPRLDYLGSTCPRIILEGQRTNLYPYSEQLNQWTASSATVTANYAVSPDGYTNADRVQFAAGGLLYVSGTGSAGENTLSVYAKATNGTSAKFRFFGNGNVTNSSDQTATGQWQRFTFTYTYSALTAGLKVATTGADDILFYGFQHEIGAQATSYIPTLAASATRGADACSKTGISSLIGQTEGTIYWEGNGSATSGGVDLWLANISVDDTSVAVLLYYVASTGTVQAFINNGTSNVILDAAMTLTQINKVAVAYKNASFALYLNGALVDSSSSAIAPPTGMNQFSFVKWTGQTNQQRALVSQSLVFKTRLTNAELATLTTL